MTMILRQDMIVDIPPNRVKFFGTTGKMLLPGRDSIEALIRKIPPHQVITTAILRQKLAKQFNVQGVCPVTTQKALKAIAHHPAQEVAYWRVINQNGGLIPYFPGGSKGHALQLMAEGFVVDLDQKTPKIQHFKEKLALLG